MSLKNADDDEEEDAPLTIRFTARFQNGVSFWATISFTSWSEDMNWKKKSKNFLFFPLIQKQQITLDVLFFSKSSNLAPKIFFRFEKE